MIISKDIFIISEQVISKGASQTTQQQQQQSQQQPQSQPQPHLQQKQLPTTGTAPSTTAELTSTAATTTTGTATASIISKAPEQETEKYFPHNSQELPGAKQRKRKTEKQHSSESDSRQHQKSVNEESLNTELSHSIDIVEVNEDLANIKATATEEEDLPEKVTEREPLVGKGLTKISPYQQFPADPQVNVFHLRLKSAKEAFTLVAHSTLSKVKNSEPLQSKNIKTTAAGVSFVVATATVTEPTNDNFSSEDLHERQSKNMAKVILGKNSRTEQAMVTFPFITSEQHRTLQLSFQNVNVINNDRKILSDVSGLVCPGEVLAIMGPSGSGKTTLLDCLSGQRRVDSGSIFLNHEQLSKRWRRKICYVLQEEVFFPGLTLRETIMYTALLRLPEKMPKEDKINLVDRMLNALELNSCQQTKFGDYMNRGLSGGEKKRANIACELLTNPLLMLLDEPTSGLDSNSAISLMKFLKLYAIQEQKTVVITVHQPSSQIFHMFDKLLLLYNGRSAYFGEVNNIYSYFENVGVAIKPHYNPADFVLEQLKSFPDIRDKLFIAAKESHSSFVNCNCVTLNTKNHNNQHQHNQHNQQQQPPNHQHPQQQNNLDPSHNKGGLTVTSADGATDIFQSTPTEIINERKPRTSGTLINDIINNYYNKHNHNHLNSHKDSILMMSNDHSSCEEAAQHLWYNINSHSNSDSTTSDCQNYDNSTDWLDYPTSFHTQFRVLSSRNFQEAKTRMLSKLNWFQTVGLALMVGAIWFQIPRTEEFLHDLQGWMFFSQTYWMLFALFGALNSFPAEREVLSKERRSGAYRLSAYYLAKMFGELPLVVTLPTVYLIISYPMLGCTSFKLFFLMLVFLLLNTIVAQSVGFFIGACCMDMNVSITLSALYTLATQLFGGYLSTRIPEGLRWLRYTSMIHYAYQNMQILEFREGPAIRCGNPSSFEICKDDSTNNAFKFIPFEEILKAQSSTAPLWLNTIILLMFFFVFRLLGYVVLRFIRCPKT